MEIWSSILGNRPPLQGQQRVSRRRLLCACQWGVLDGFAHRTRRMGKCFSKFNRWFKRGVRSELFEQLSRRWKALILNASWSIPLQWEAIIRPWEPRAETNASAGRPAARQRRSAWLSMCAKTRSTSPSQRSMSTIHKETRSLIQIAEEKYQSKAGKRDVEERG